MKWNELKRIAISKGWRLSHHGKKHDVYYHPDKTYIIEFERHGSEEVRNGIMYKILKQL